MLARKTVDPGSDSYFYKTNALAFKEFIKIITFSGNRIFIDVIMNLFMKIYVTTIKCKKKIDFNKGKHEMKVLWVCAHKTLQMPYIFYKSKNVPL